MTPPRNQREDGKETPADKAPDTTITSRMTSSQKPGPVKGKRDEYLKSEPYKTKSGNIRQDS